MLQRRAVTVVGVVVALTVGVGHASAPLGIFEEAGPGAPGGPGRFAGSFTFGTLTSQFLGLCPAGGRILADAAGVSMDTVIAGARAVDGRGRGVGELDFAAIVPAGPDAFAACDRDLPPDWFE